MGTMDYIDRKPHKAQAAGEGGTVYLHTVPVEVTYVPAPVIKVQVLQPTLIEVEYMGEV